MFYLALVILLCPVLFAYFLAMCSTSSKKPNKASSPATPKASNLSPDNLSTAHSIPERDKTLDPLESRIDLPFATNTHEFTEEVSVIPSPNLKREETKANKEGARKEKNKVDEKKGHGVDRRVEESSSNERGYEEGERGAGIDRKFEESSNDKVKRGLVDRKPEESSSHVESGRAHTAKTDRSLYPPESKFVMSALERDLPHGTTLRHMPPSSSSKGSNKGMSSKSKKQSRREKAVQIDTTKICWAGKGEKRYIRVKHPGAGRHAMKIKCSDNAMYHIDPVYSFVEPGKHTIITVKRVGDKHKNDKMVLLFAPGGAHASDPAAVFKTTPQEKQTQITVPFTTK